MSPTSRCRTRLISRTSSSSSTCSTKLARSRNESTPTDWWILRRRFLRDDRSSAFHPRRAGTGGYRLFLCRALERRQRGLVQWDLVQGLLVTHRTGFDRDHHGRQRRGQEHAGAHHGWHRHPTKRHRPAFPGIYPAVRPGVRGPTSDERRFPLADGPRERALSLAETGVGRPRAPRPHLLPNESVPPERAFRRF